MKKGGGAGLIQSPAGVRLQVRPRESAIDSRPRRRVAVRRHGGRGSAADRRLPARCAENTDLETALWEAESRWRRYGVVSRSAPQLSEPKWSKESRP